MEVVRVGLLGLGTVGTGVVKTIRMQEQRLSDRIGRKVEIVKILVKNLQKERSLSIAAELLTTSFEDLLNADVHVIVEAMGGVEPTGSYLEQAIRKGCHVVTANKELLARKGRHLIRLANEHVVHFYYEASVGGGIPVLSVLRQFLRTNEITSAQGIINGTTNYILTQMEEFGRSYEDVLQEAQQLGYAELDPTADVEGFDALHKLYILSQLVFGQAPELGLIPRTGISRLSLEELKLAKQLGYRFKLLASAEKEEEDIRLSVSPSLLPLDHPLAGIKDSFNAVQISGNIVGDLMFTGRGAGELPTASAVVEDLAFLLTYPFVPHSEWNENKNLANPKAQEWVLLTAKHDHLPKLLVDLEEYEVEILCVESYQDWFGCIVQGITSEQAKQLQVNRYPIAALVPEQEKSLVENKLACFSTLIQQ